MKKEKLEKIKDRLIDVLSKDSGYFGRIDTLGLRPSRYEFIGYQLNTDIMPLLITLSERNLNCLMKIINYFEIHANPLKKLIIRKDGQKQSVYDIYSDLAWSHFMTVVMFGMLEVAAKNSPSCIKWKNKQKGYFDKYKRIENFLIKFLSEETQKDIAKRYKTEDNNRFNSFTDVTKHMWDKIRSGFVHEASLQNIGMEWIIFGGGIGTREDPIEIEAYVPMQELIKITWQAILNSLGYDGLLEEPLYKNK